MSRSLPAGAARLDGKTVPIEAFVNAYPVAKKDIIIDGSLQEISLEVPIERSSCVAFRLYSNAYTNPVFITVGGQPIRASRKSAELCLHGVDQCWKEQQKFYADAEQAEAANSYDHARAVNRRILKESKVD